jgi:hemolysin activation/secretion protein
LLGNLDLSANQLNQALDKAGPRTEGSYFKLIWNAARLQRLNQDFSLWLSVQGQIADTNLDSSESMSLGGAHGVRAYPALEAGGDSAMLFTTELRYRLSRNYSLTAFYDHGNVEQKATSNRDSQTTSLSGYGVSVDWVAAEKAFSATLSIAHRIGSNPLADPVTGDDSDGSLDEYPIWLSMSKQF